MVLILTISLGLSLISCTFELTNNLYFSEDNRVLITLPVDTNKIFVSKIIVFYLYELKKSLNFLMPLTLLFFMDVFVDFYPACFHLNVTCFNWFIIVNSCDVYQKIFEKSASPSSTIVY